MNPNKPNDSSLDDAANVASHSDNDGMMHGDSMPLRSLFALDTDVHQILQPGVPHSVTRGINQLWTRAY